MNENGMGPIETSPPPLPPPGDWWSSTPLDRLTSLPVAQLLFSPSVNWQPGLLVWGWTSLSRLRFFLSVSPSFSHSVMFPFMSCLLPLLPLSKDTPPPHLPCSTCLTLPLRRSDTTFIYRSNKPNMKKKLL